MTAGTEYAIPLEWETVSSACQHATDRFVELLRSAPDAQASVPGHDWTVAEVAWGRCSTLSHHIPDQIVRGPFPLGQNVFQQP